MQRSPTGDFFAEKDDESALAINLIDFKKTRWTAGNQRGTKMF